MGYRLSYYILVSEITFVYGSLFGRKDAYKEGHFTLENHHICPLIFSIIPDNESFYLELFIGKECFVGLGIIIKNYVSSNSVWLKKPTKILQDTK